MEYFGIERVYKKKVSIVMANECHYIYREKYSCGILCIILYIYRRRMDYGVQMDGHKLVQLTKIASHAYDRRLGSE